MVKKSFLSSKAFAMIKYSEKEVEGFHCYIYEWIDELGFCLRPSDGVRNWESYEAAVKEKFRSHGWSGNGHVQLMWLPPFALKGVLADGVDSFLSKVGESWTSGLVLWHTKQKEDGLSFILSPVRLEIPDLGLEK
jgi:hypothetical protein